MKLPAGSLTPKYCTRQRLQNNILLTYNNNNVAVVSLTKELWFLMLHVFFSIKTLIPQATHFYPLTINLYTIILAGWLSRKVKGLRMSRSCRPARSAIQKWVRTQTRLWSSRLWCGPTQRGESGTPRVLSTTRAANSCQPKHFPSLWFSGHVASSSAKLIHIWI